MPGRLKLLLLILMVNAIECISETIDCKNILVGIYKVHGLYGSLNTIVRTKEIQIESSGASNLVVQYNIKWTSDCTYLLYNKEIVKGKENDSAITGSDTLYNEIIEVNYFWSKIIYTVNRSEPMMEENYFNVDTSLIYKNFDELDKLKDYDGPTSGGTFVGYNYAITYKQNVSEKNKFRIVFLESLMFGDKSKFKVLDNVECVLDTNQKITITNCMYSDKYDKEIAAIYYSADSTQETQIVKAWRFNKLKLKIEEVETEKVKFKEADKNLPKWEN